VNILVCAKQIPDPQGPQRLTDDGRLDRSGKLLLDDADTYGVELGLQLAEAAGGEVTVVSMVPNAETGGVRQALAMGAAKAVVVSDPALAGADALVSARVLAAVAQRVGAELVITATESSDGYTGTVAGQIAALLEWPALTFAKRVTLESGVLRADRQTDDGFWVCEAALPAVLSVTAGVVEPRYPSFKGIMSAKSKPVEQLDLAELGLAAKVRQEVVAVREAPGRSAGQIIEDAGDAEAAIVAFLESVKVL
jgi:electron transfer flavoprotein beta subunit